MEFMTIEEIRPKIESLVQRVFDEAGMELIDLIITGHKNDLNIQITVDKLSGGINIMECARLNKAVVAAISQEELLSPEIFSLELSSPGLDRPLVSRRDFLRFKAHELHFWLNEPVNGKKEVQGILNEVGESALTIEAGKSKLNLPLSAIIKGMLVI